MLLGCIGDDFTGSSDLANTLAKQGMRVVQYTGIPGSAAPDHIEAGVVALKSRSIKPSDAVTQSLKALEWLREQGCSQFFFKYCSTFDSTPEGNIGPVAEALARELNADRVIVCPAFPGTGRSVYQGHLFVNDRLLSESGMENHPLTPMTDADLRRWLAPQTTFQIGHVSATDVLAGSSAIRAALTREHDNGARMVVVDALRDEDLMHIGEAVDDLALITGGSGVALGLPANFRRRGQLADAGSGWRGESGASVALCGSCSNATRAQIEHHRKAAEPMIELSVAKVISGDTTAAALAEWVQDQWQQKSDAIPLIYSSADPAAVADIQQTHGREQTADALESLFARLAEHLVAAGARRLLVAGGETSGAVVEGLSLADLEIGPEIDPGVPALRAGPDLVIALKSGNFGSVDFFNKAAQVLGTQA